MRHMKTLEYRRRSVITQWFCAHSGRRMISRYALGRRVSTTTLECTIRHVYDGVQCIADVDADGDVVVSYTWGAGIDNLLATRIGGETYYPLTDIQGTVWGYVDSATNIVARFEYDAWGNILSAISSVSALARNRYRFQCREWSAATGLVNFRARWYDPATGRWLSKDPIGLSGGLNLYAFCGDDPVNKFDSFGLSDDDNKKPAAIAVLGPPRLGPSGNTYRADPLGHGTNPITGKPYDPHIHQIDRRGNTTTFDLDGTPRGSGNIPKRDAAAFGKAVMDAAKYMLKVPMIIVMPPGFFLPPGTI